MTNRTSNLTRAIVPLFIVSFFFFLVIPQVTSADSGWYSSVVVTGNNTSCGTGRSQFQFVLAEHNSRTPIADASGITVTLEAHNWDSQDAVGSEVISTNRAVSLPICYNPMTQIVDVKVTYTTTNPLYHPFRTDWWFYTNDSFRVIQREKNIREYGHLLPKSLSALPTLSPISPTMKILSVNPRYRFSLNKMTSLYGTTGIYEIVHRVFTIGAETNIKREYNDGGRGVGIRTLPEINGLSDGYYFWSSMLVANGRHQILETSSGILTSIFNAIHEPKSSRMGNFSLTRFLLDRRTPTSVVTTGSQTTVPGGVTVMFNNSVHDPLSGLLRTTLHIRGIRGDTSTIVQPTPFTQGSGLVGGPKNPQGVSIPVTFTIGRAQYEYYTITVDAAGNSFRSPTQRFTVPNIPVPPCTPGDPGCPSPCPPTCSPPCPPTCIPPCSPNCPVGGGTPTIVATPILVRKGEETTIQWTIPSSAGSCTLSGGSLVDNDTNNSNSGSSPVTVNNQTTYTITCSNGNSDSVTVRTLQIIEET